MKNFLVTGGSGFIGSHLVEELVRTGHQVRLLDDLSTGSLNYRPQNVELVMGDVADPAVVARAMRDMDGCFHLAAVASVERGNTDWIGSHRTNITGTITVFDTARTTAMPIVYASSAAVYGANPDILYEEDTKPRPLSAYGADKYSCELRGYVASHVHGVPNVGLRFFNVYGPRQDPTSPYSGVITIFANRLKANQPITINGDGYHSRDFVYVGDVVRALMKGMEHCVRGGNDVFNVCTGIDTNIIDLAEDIGIAFGRNPKISFGPPRPGDPRRSVGSPEKARRILGFEAATDLPSGLAATLDVQERACSISGPAG